jgi:hypothetical protein
MLHDIITVNIRRVNIMKLGYGKIIIVMLTLILK